MLQPKPDGRQSATARSVQRGVCRLMQDHGFAVLTEFTLASGRRADVIGIKDDGVVWIVEIKSSLIDFQVDQKWPEYRDYCDRLFFAVPKDFDHRILPEDAGLLLADQWGADILRETNEHPLHAARRKSVTLAFARTAASRLQNLFDPQLPT
jgi:hypothetical protein